MAFHDFLCCMDSRAVRVAHVQLLAAGSLRVFAPWVSLIQMARAYGQWFRARERPELSESLVVNVYVVDPGLIVLLQGNFIDLLKELEDISLHIEIEVIDALGEAEREHNILPADAKVATLVKTRPKGKEPRVYAHPRPKLGGQSGGPDQSLREFGLVSGSTLIIDYRDDFTRGRR